MLKKYLRSIKSAFDPFEQSLHTRPLKFIGYIRFAISLLMTVSSVLLLLVFFAFIYHSFFCNENHITTQYKKMLPSISIIAEVPNNAQTNLESIGKPMPNNLVDKNVDFKYLNGLYRMNLYPSNSHPVFFIWMLFFLRSVFQIFILFFLRKVLSNIIRKDFFVRNTYFYLRLTGLLAVLSSLINVFINWFLSSNIYNVVNFDQIAFFLDWKFGIIVLIVAEIFYAGVKIKEENDLTV